eukprot:TRINITY_DN2651_c0_g1_i1.p1 TRINITY_DN2651_c0_g1~~TRINITY_DN2651_c0_g1_i1.p1  ORF type:complete len:180 (-),score=20.46 TRINITY_DN2651_c0_g1_i1:42-581(-)
MNIHKVAACGAPGSGKSALTIFLVQNEFLGEYDPTIEDSYRKQLKVDDQLCVLEILDTASREDFYALLDIYIRDNDGFLCLYSINSRESFDAVPSYIQRIFDIKQTTKVPIIVVGNKSDLGEERQVATKEGEELASSLDVLFMETSAKTGHNVHESFNQLVRAVRKNIETPIRRKHVQK